MLAHVFSHGASKTNGSKLTSGGKKSDGVGVLTNAHFSADLQILNAHNFREIMSSRSADAAHQCACANLFNPELRACVVEEVLQVAYKGQE